MMLAAKKGGNTCRILVMGSTGTVGSAVTEQLAQRNADVYALVHQRKHSFSKNVTTIEGDVTDMGSMRRALKSVETLFVLNPVVADELNRALLTLDLAIEGCTSQCSMLTYFSTVLMHAQNMRQS